MNKFFFLTFALGGALFVGGCTYDEGPGYGGGRVSVSTGGYSPGYEDGYGGGYGGGYDGDSPYYAYSGRRYYRSGGRYVYYANRRPYYVAVLPSGARYTTPTRERRSFASDRYREERQAESRYRTLQNQPQRRDYADSARERERRENFDRPQMQAQTRSYSQERIDQSRVRPQSDPQLRPRAGANERREDPRSRRQPAPVNVRNGDQTQAQEGTDKPEGNAKKKKKNRTTSQRVAKF